jgi:hypothetical protein
VHREERGQRKQFIVHVNEITEDQITLSRMVQPGGAADRITNIFCRCESRVRASAESSLNPFWQAMVESIQTDQKGTKAE